MVQAKVTALAGTDPVRRIDVFGRVVEVGAGPPHGGSGVRVGLTVQGWATAAGALQSTVTGALKAAAAAHEPDPPRDLRPVGRVPGKVLGPYRHAGSAFASGLAPLVVREQFADGVRFADLEAQIAGT
ncbi:hypothetical protein [Streptomyces sp. H27-D2]|uniref:hypothetical protein n=1 Tax=Streptomyces sp. H27-D2 TaxID=3046304 RepID=UPI002DBF93F5|nr:hypothetical protein [Streptomyces sp. H27-D2]MEC4016369.1 hypothetical protein [Streptomyces sp. H27-D2]